MNAPKILIVDDEEYNVDYLEQELEDLHYQTSSAGDGQKALDQVKADPPDLVLLDIMMPVLDGFEVLSRMKADAEWRDIPVIVISANNDLQSVVRCIKLGAEDYLPKPFDPTLLHARISSSLEKKRLRDLQQLYLKSLQRELEIGRQIQQGFLPAVLPDVPGWEIASCFRAAREVAGDFYDAFMLSTGNLACVIGDVCDKGVGAALFMTLFRSLIRAACTTDFFQDGKELPPILPAERLQHVINFTNQYITGTHEDANMFATIFIGIVNPQDGRLTYINCGHEPPLILRADCPPLALQPTGPAVGILPGANFTVKETILRPGDLLLTYTDGIPDALNGEKARFGHERLEKLLKNPMGSSRELLKGIESVLCEFIGTTDQFDDITMLALRRDA